MERRTLNILVVDSSVVVKWYVLEEFRSEALAIRDDYLNGLFRLAAPSLMVYEVVNAVRYSRKDIQPEKLKAICESLAKYGFDLYELKGEYANLTIDIAIENNITVYDASYIALAQYLDTSLYTSDTKLLQSLKGNYKMKIKHLKDYKTP
ncbi:MAG: type II toxin-antitoxin system VapC family toxin [Nitrososphaeria archaeon]|nr:type II toxin-antitoxin system VapC family toxin [Nitrososphaeria archaeon]